MCIYVCGHVSVKELLFKTFYFNFFRLIEFDVSEEDGLPDGSCFHRTISRPDSRTHLNPRSAAIRPAKVRSLIFI